MKKIFILAVMMAMLFVFSVQARADLQYSGVDSLGNRLIYDTDFDITWYDYTNSANTWQNQVDWADALDVNFGGTHYTDWRLPTTFQPDPSCDGHSPFSPYEGYGHNCTGSEMGHLYYTELDQAGGPLTDTGDFQNLQSYGYWSGTEYHPGGNYSWVFYFPSGGQAGSAKSSNYYALAVRPGAVPEPGTLLLLGSGLIGLAFYSKRKFRKIN